MLDWWWLFSFGFDSSNTAYNRPKILDKIQEKPYFYYYKCYSELAYAECWISPSTPLFLEQTAMPKTLPSHERTIGQVMF